MTALINITEYNGQQVASAKELYLFLGYDSSQWSRWSKKNIADNEFAIENEDYCALDTMSSNSKSTDFAIKIDFAKKISMMARTEKGEEARKYFIECERKLLQPELSRKDLALMVIKAEEEKEVLLAENNRLKPRSEFVDLVFNTTDLIKMSEVAKVLELPYGRNTLFKKLRDKEVLFKNSNEPYQHLVNKGYFKLKEVIVKRQDKEPLIRMQTLVTQKGLGYIAKVLEVIRIPKTLMKSA